MVKREQRVYVRFSDDEATVVEQARQAVGGVDEAVFVRAAAVFYSRYLLTALAATPVEQLPALRAALGLPPIKADR